MSNDFSPEQRREMLDDFYAECDELLTAIRQGLAQLDSGKLSAPDTAKVVESLFRSTHSLKGISAIVGLRAAEELAHAMEDVLRALSHQEVTLTDALVDDLLAAAQRLEQIAVSHRAQKPLPEIRDLVEKLRPSRPHKPKKKRAGSAAAPAPAAAPSAAPDPVAAARERGLPVYRAAFSVSPELDRRGVNVNSVRERLKGLGEILSTTPVVKAKGAIVFEFVVALKSAPDDLAGWSADGIVFTEVAPDAPSSPADRHAASPSTTEAAPADTLSLTPSHIVRVDLARLDDLMRIAGEMVIQRSRLDDRLQQDQATYAALKDVNLALGRSLREMREAIARVRMVPIDEIFARMPFVVRDLMRSSEKRARVVLEGPQTEVDKYLVERLKEPLLHLVRNAFAHGIETPAQRAAAGKPEEATITLRARSAGESVVIQIRDDGRGIDAAAVVRQAGKAGIKVPARVDAAALLDILCAPGFSTRAEADLAAGRGVGMAVVANTVRELGGLLTVETWPGQGTEFTLRLPLTLSIADAIIVVINGETCAIPQGAVDEIIQLPAPEARTIRQTEVIRYRNGLLPLVRLGKMFPGRPVEAATMTILVVSGERGRTGLVVDRVRTQREIVIRQLADPLLRVPGISGATELGDGRPILILDPAVLTQGVVRPVEADAAELTATAS